MNVQSRLLELDRGPARSASTDRATVGSDASYSLIVRAIRTSTHLGWASAEIEAATAPGLRRSGGSPAWSPPHGPAPAPGDRRPRPGTGGFRSPTERARARS